MSETRALWTIVFERQAEQALGELRGEILQRIDGAILALAENPRPRGSQKLPGAGDFYRIRVGDWRIIYAIEDDRLVVLVIKMAHRREVYRNA